MTPPDLRLLTEGSVWIDEKMRTIVVWRIHWANMVNVGSFDLLVIPDMTIANRDASKVESLVRNGKLQFCKDCNRI
ncbi:MAG: hypothetical protein ACK41O_18320 [Runella zeae]